MAQEFFPTVGRNNYSAYLLDLRAQRPELSERIRSVKFGVSLRVLSPELSKNQLALDQFQEIERLILV